ADHDVEWSVGENGNINSVSEIGDMDSADNVSVRIDAAAHFKGIEWIEVRVAIRTVMAIDSDRRDKRAALSESDGVGRGVGGAWFGPLIAVHDPTATGNCHLDGAASRGRS